MRKLILTFLSIGLAGMGISAEAGSRSLSSPQFERLKTLAGTWEGMVRANGIDQKVAVEYQVTSAGNAVLERLYPGTAYEMISVYYNQDGGKVFLTHYSMARSSPRLELKLSDDNRMRFGLAKGSDINQAKRHMHSLDLQWIDGDNIVREWTSFKAGKPQARTTLRVARVKDNEDPAMSQVESQTEDKASEYKLVKVRDGAEPASKKAHFKAITDAWKLIVGD